MESVASTLDFIRKQSAARRSDYDERWKVDADDDKTIASRPLMEADNSISCIGDQALEVSKCFL